MGESDPARWVLRSGNQLRPLPPGDEVGAVAAPTVPGADLDVAWRLDGSPVGDLVALHRFRDGTLVAASLHPTGAPVPSTAPRVGVRSPWWRRVAWRSGELGLLDAVDPMALDGSWQALDLGLALHHRMFAAAAPGWPTVPAGLWWLAGPGRRVVRLVADAAVARLAADRAG